MKARIKLDVVWIDLSERAAHHHDVPRFPTVLSVGDAQDARIRLRAQD